MIEDFLLLSSVLCVFLGAYRLGQGAAWGVADRVIARTDNQALRIAVALALLGQRGERLVRERMEMEGRV